MNTRRINQGLFTTLFTLMIIGTAPVLVAEESEVLRLSEPV